MTKRATFAVCIVLAALSVSMSAQDAESLVPKPMQVGKRIVSPESNVAREGQFHTNFEIVVLGNKSASGVDLTDAVLQPEVGPPYKGYGAETPASIACAYLLVTVTTGCDPDTVTAVPITRGAKNIAIVDAYDNPNALADLTTFSKQFGLPAPTSANFTVVYATGSKPGTDPTGGWETEEALDIEYTHAMAPKAHIYLVEAADNSDASLFQAEEAASTLLAAHGGGEVTNSWGGAEFSGETVYDSDFVKTNVVFFASSGDGPGTSYPCVSPNVVCVGGTTFNRNPATFAFEHETGWDLAGSGLSLDEARPSYQNVISTTITHRMVPDVSALANPYTGAWICDSYNGYIYGVNGTCWYPVGGTSLASPLTAGIVNGAGSFKASTAAEQTLVYSSYTTVNYAKYWRDITYGYCFYNEGYFDGIGFDHCTGLGSPITYSGK